MPSFMKLITATMALGGLGASGMTLDDKSRLSVGFRRYSEPNCDSAHIIEDDVTLQAGKCHHFKTDEPPFESFKTVGTWNHFHKSWDNDCRIAVYSLPGCKGDVYNPGAITGNDDTTSKCGNVPNKKGRSAQIVCDALPENGITLSDAPTSTSITVAALSSTSTTTVTVSSAASPSSTSTTTVTQLTTMPAITVSDEPYTTVTLAPATIPTGCSGDC